MSLCNGWYKTTILRASGVNPLKLFIVIMSMVMGLPLGVHAQTITTAKIIAAGGNLKIQALPTSGGTEVLFIDPTTLNVSRRVIARTDLATAVAYEDESNTFTQVNTFSANNIFSVNQTFSADINVNGGDIFSTGALVIRPTGNLTLDPTGDVIIGADGLDVLPATGYTYNIGALTNKYLTLHAAELWVETLVAQNTIATIGGRILVGPTTTLTSDLASGATSMIVKHNQMASGARVYLEANGSVEWIAVTSGPSGGGPYTYSITRNLDGSGANNWTAGDAVFNTGTTGNGFIDLYSVAGVLSSGSGPAIVGRVRTGTTYNQVAERWAAGNLNGLYGYAMDIYGFAAGDPTDENFTIDPTNGFRIRSNTTTVMQLTGSALTIDSGNTLINTDGIVLTPPAGSVISTRGYTFDHGGSFLAGMHFYHDASIAFLDLLSIDNLTSSLNGAVIQINSGITGGPQAAASFNGDATNSTIQFGAKNRIDLVDLTGTNRITFAMDNSTAPGGSQTWIRTSAGGTVINAGPAAGLYLNTDTSVDVITGGHFYPNTNGTKNLGAPSNKWAHVYMTEITTGTALFPVVSNSGHLEVKNDGLNGTTTCGGGQKVSSITFEFGIATAITCS